MKRALAVSALVLCLVACGEDPKAKQDKNCIDPNTFANICIENALREEERKSSAYLDQKFAKEDKQFEFNKLPVEEQKEQIAQGTAPSQTVVHHHHNHSGGNGFLTGMLVGHVVTNMFSGPSHQPVQQTFAPRPTYYSPPRPLGPSPAAKPPSVLVPALKTAGTAVAAPVKRWFPSNPKPTVQVPVVRPIPPANSYVKPSAPIPTPAKPSWFKPKAVETPTVKPQAPTVAPKPSWSAPKAAPTPAPAPKPSWSAPTVRPSSPSPSFRSSTPSFRPSFGRR